MIKRIARFFLGVLFMLFAFEGKSQIVATPSAGCAPLVGVSFTGLPGASSIVWTFGDATSEISFFGLNTNDKNHLIQKLSTTKRPDLTDILEQEDVFIDLLIGQDMGYWTCLSVYSKTDISSQIKNITTDIYNKCKLYEENIDNIKTIDEFINEMKKINGC